MDEATPHVHIDFVPYITGSKRSMDTRVSLKQALAQLGFKGGTRSATEWNQWVQSENKCWQRLCWNTVLSGSSLERTRNIYLSWTIKAGTSERSSRA